MALAKFAGRLVGLYWGRDRVPGLGRERRWFMGQPYMVPRHSQDFFGFAERLTGERRDSESPDQVRKLLVHAFLEDLRVAYRRTRWGFLPRRRGLRRTTHVTVLLDDVDAPGGWELLRLVNEVRNETGELDPLLIITTSGERPASLTEPRVLTRPSVAEAALTEWKGRLPKRRQLLAEDARYLFVTLPAAASPEAALDVPDKDAWNSEEREQPRPEPRLARRGVAEVMVVLVLLAALGDARPGGQGPLERRLRLLRRDLRGVATEVAKVDGHDQCVGYSDRALQVFGSNPRLRLAQENVFAQNAEAERLHGEVPNRPYVSLVYFAGLTANDSTPATEHSVAEELEGLVIRQREQNTTTSATEPLLRVVVANGGTDMAVASTVARDMIVPLTRADPSILGVVGLDRSVSETEAAIKEFGQHGIPTLGTTLTKVGLDELSPLYFQLVPDNSKQAELLGDYARRIEATAVTIYHSPVDGTNTYVTSLVAAMRDKLGAGGVPVSESGWVDSPTELPTLCADQTDRSREMVFYAGRENDVGDFLRTIRRNCADLSKLPRIVADDATSRFVAHAPGRRQNAFNGLSISYVGMGGLVVLAGRSCVEGKSGALVGGAPALDAFCAGYHELYGELASLPAEERPVYAVAGGAGRRPLRHGGSVRGRRAPVAIVRLGPAAPGGDRPAVPRDDVPRHHGSDRLPRVADRQQQEPRGAHHQERQRPRRRRRRAEVRADGRHTLQRHAAPRGERVPEAAVGVWFPQVVSQGCATGRSGAARSVGELPVWDGRNPWRRLRCGCRRSAEGRPIRVAGRS